MKVTIDIANFLILTRAQTLKYLKSSLCFLEGCIILILQESNYAKSRKIVSALKYAVVNLREAWEIFKFWPEFKL